MDCALCAYKNQPVARACVKWAKTSQPLCKECFFHEFEEGVFHTLQTIGILRPNMRLAVGASGGKDSTALIHVLESLNKRYNLQLDLVLVSIDEGIRGYRDDSLDAVKRNHADYGWPLTIISFEELFGWTMDRIDTALCGRNGTFCGTFRRQALDRGAEVVKADYLATGHCADDVAETVLMNVIRGDVTHLVRCADFVSDSCSEMVPRVKPFMETYERDIVMYCHLKRLDYVATECIYAPQSFRGQAREFLKRLSRIHPGGIYDIVQVGHDLSYTPTTSTSELNAKPTAPPVELRKCNECHLPCTGVVCRACVLLSGLTKGAARSALKLDSEQWVKEKEQEQEGDDTNKIKRPSGRFKQRSGRIEAQVKAMRRERALIKQSVGIGKEIGGEGDSAALNMLIDPDIERKRKERKERERNDDGGAGDIEDIGLGLSFNMFD